MLKYKILYDTIIQIYQDNPKYFKLDIGSKSLGVKQLRVLNEI